MAEITAGVVACEPCPQELDEASAEALLGMRIPRSDYHPGRSACHRHRHWQRYRHCHRHWQRHRIESVGVDGDGSPGEVDHGDQCVGTLGNAVQASVQSVLCERRRDPLGWCLL
ncbi:hypothetical protein [Streptomyces sp. x-80]|uniref:hypothetical protein n=1 Tax=Streptomyces sp. x-80 TaxID=2789282 RepID=UPI00397EAD01